MRRWKQRWRRWNNSNRHAEFISASIHIDSEINSERRNCIYSYFLILTILMSKLFHIARILASIILLQTLYFKFTAHPESVELFTAIGMEPDGRIGTGIVELIAWLLLLFGGQYIRLWAILGILLMTGAIHYHITIIWVDMLFWMAVVTFISCAYVLYSSWKVNRNLSAFDGGVIGD